jgi:hypothetical protein
MSVKLSEGRSFAPAALRMTRSLAVVREERKAIVETMSAKK